MMLSTPWGKRGVFFEEWTGGEGVGALRSPGQPSPAHLGGLPRGGAKTLRRVCIAQEYECSFEEVDDACSPNVIERPSPSRGHRPAFGGTGLAKFYVGLDLGQASDYTAIAVAESGQARRLLRKAMSTLHIRHLESFRHVIYPDVSERVKGLLGGPP